MISIYHTASSQELKLDLDVTGTAGVDISSLIKETYPDKESALIDIQKLLMKLYGEGYLAATIDSMDSDSKILEVYLTTGEKYKWARLKPGNVNEGWLSRIGYREKLFTNQILNYEDVASLLNKLLQIAGNSGYPFASVQLDSLKVEDQSKVSAVISLEKGEEFFFTELRVIGDAKVDKSFLESYLNVKPGEPYNEKAIKQADKQLKDLNFIEVNQPTEVEFFQNQARLILYIDNRKASRFTGVLGVSPRSQVNNKLLITGEVSLHLENPLKKAMRLDIAWQKAQTNTQELNLIYAYPYVLTLPLEAEVQFSLLKYDSLFLNLNTELGMKYLYNGFNAIHVFYRNSTSSLLVETEPDQAVLNDLAGININAYGLGWYAERLDYRLLPRKGYEFEVAGSVGQKKINEIGSWVKHDSTDDLNSVIYEFILEGRYFWKTGNRSTLLTGMQSMYLLDENPYDNQYYRFGGIYTLRGFDDRSLFATSYIIGNFEYRYFTGEESFIQLFTDVAYYEQNSVSGSIEDTPLGFGAGYTFRAGNGIFSINYAYGSQQGNPIDLRAGRIHFGFLNRF